MEYNQEIPLRKHKQNVAYKNAKKSKRVIGFISTNLPP